ncbi:MAG: chorismate synthase [Candidatus Omnitrophica bacterium]|nr:chorismate synthase [Candidatus Omnitrophota bacterium]
MLRRITAGESHGRALLGILEGIPAGLKLDIKFINQELKRRQQGFGRGERMRLENDKAQILSGIKNNITLGSPIAILIENKDFRIEDLAKVLFPRPGHADLAGLLKYGFNDCRNVLERASARETAVRVAIGAICKLFLKEFKITIESKVISVGGETQEDKIKQKILLAREKKDTLGGIFEVKAKNVPVGLGSYIQADRRLDAKIAGIIMSIPGIKGVEIGLGFGYAEKFGSQVHDPIYYSKEKGFFRKTNNAGGIEGGISNGEEIILRACIKPISTLLNPLDSVNILTKQKGPASIERADICVVESAGVVAESEVAYVLTDAFLEKFGQDNLKDIKRAFKAYKERIKM